MKDDELIAGFEEGTLAPGAFGHREHLRLTWLYLQRLERPDAERRLLAGLRGFAARAGRPEKFSAPLTLAWIGRVDDARAGLGADHRFEDLMRAHPELSDRNTVREMAHPL